MPQPPREIGTRQRGTRVLGGGFVKAPFSFFLPGGECAGDWLSWWISSGERRLQLDAPSSRKIHCNFLVFLGCSSHALSYIQRSSFSSITSVHSSKVSKLDIELLITCLLRATSSPIALNKYSTSSTYASKLRPNAAGLFDPFSSC